MHMITVYHSKARGGLLHNGGKMDIETTPGRRARRQRKARRATVVALATAIVLAAFAGSGFAQSGGNSAKALPAAKDPASGTPVKVGFVYDGRTVSLDSTYQLKASEAIVKYLNEH